jgi:hypothetical protein
LARTFDAVAVALMVMLGATYLALVWLVLPVLPPLPSAVVPLTLAPAIGLGFVCWAVSRRFEKHGDAELSALARRSRLLYRIVAATFAAYVILAVIAAVLQPDQDWAAGQPEIIGGHYYLNVHGGLVPITKAEYQHDLRIGEMAFLSVAMLLNLANLFNLAGTGRNAPARNPLTSRP